MKADRRHIIASCIFLLSIISLIAALSVSSYAALRPVSGYARDYDGPVMTTIDGEYVGMEYTPIIRKDLRPFARLIYSITIPDYVKDGEAVAIRLNSTKFNVYLEQTLLYSYYPEAGEEGRPEYGYGTTFYIPLPDSSVNKELRIEAVVEPAVSGINLAFIKFGDFASLEVETLFWEIEPLIISYTLSFMAFIAFLAFCFAKETDTRKSLLSSAFLLMLLSLWLFFQSRSRQYIVENTVLPATVSNFCIFFLPYALYNYFIYNYPLRKERKLRGFYFTSLIFIACYYIVGILSFIGVYGYSECLTLATTFVLAYAALLFLYVCYLFFAEKEKVGIFLIIISIMIVSFLIEWILLILKIGLNTSVTLEVLACSTVAILFKSLSVYLLETKERAEKEAALTAVYRDPLTMLRNRSSYDSIITQPWHGERFVDVYVIDVNNLKHVNDSQGHSAGNMLLKEVAEAIIGTFPYFNQLGYRTGGDEFVVFSPSSPDRSPEILTERLKSKLSSKHGDNVVSIGYVRIDTKKVKLRDAVDLADGRMYDDKKSEKNF